MTNFEMYRDELLKLSQGGTFIVISETGQPMASDKPGLISTMIEWGFYEYNKPPMELFRLEYEFLKRIKKSGFKFIARDKRGNPFCICRYACQKSFYGSMG